MASGTITLTKTGNGNMSGQLLWKSVSNGTNANTSLVTVDVQLKRPTNAWTRGTWRGPITIGGTTTDISKFLEVKETWITVATASATVSHNADGSCSCRIYCKINGPTETSMAGTYVSCDTTVVLDTIPRYASIASATNFTDEDKTGPTIVYSNPAGDAVDYLQACISLDGSDDDVPYKDIPRTGTSYTFSLSEAERNTLRAAAPNSNYLDVEVYVRSSIGGNTKAYYVPSRMSIVNANPTINPTITDSNNVTRNLTGDPSTLVRYYSNAAITIGASVNKFADKIKSQKVTCGSKSLTANGTINGVESSSFVFTATDSRGNTETKTITPSTGQIKFVNYVKLTCNLENNIPDTNGSMQVRVTGNYFNGSFGAKNNSLSVYYRYRSSTGSFDEWIPMSMSRNGNTYSATASVTGLDYRTAYVFEAYAVDALATVYSASKTVKATPVFDWSETDFRFNVPVTLGDGAGSVRLTAQDNLDDIRTNGWYDWLSGSAPANAPSGTSTGSIYSMRVFSRGYACIQECCDTTTNRGCVIQRTLNDDGATPWEWVNPPMIAGYEFRTTERYNGKPVYATLVNYGVLPNKDNKNVLYRSMGSTGVVSCTAMLSDGNVLHAGVGRDRSITDAPTITLDCTFYNVRIITDGDASSVSAYVLVKYTID